MTDNFTVVEKFMLSYINEQLKPVWDRLMKSVSQETLYSAQSEYDEELAAYLNIIDGTVEEAVEGLKTLLEMRIEEEYEDYPGWSTEDTLTEKELDEIMADNLKREMNILEKDLEIEWEDLDNEGEVKSVNKDIKLDWEEKLENELDDSIFSF